MEFWHNYWSCYTAPTQDKSLQTNLLEKSHDWWHYLSDDLSVMELCPRLCASEAESAVAGDISHVPSVLEILSAKQLVWDDRQTHDKADNVMMTYAYGAVAAKFMPHPHKLHLFGEINLYQKIFCYTTTFPCTAHCFTFIIYLNDVHRDQWIKNLRSCLCDKTSCQWEGNFTSTGFQLYLERQE